MTLVELIDVSGQPVWINPDFVVRVEWTSPDSATITLGISQENNGKMRPQSLAVALPAQTVVAILRGEQNMPPRTTRPARAAKPAE